MSGLKRAGIVIEASRLLEGKNLFGNLTAEFSIGGDYHAAERIIQAIRHHFGRGDRPKEFKPKTQAQTTPANFRNIEINANAMQ